MSVRVFVLLLALALGGCSVGVIVQTVPPVPDLSQPDYRRIVAANIKTIFPNQTSVGDLQISDLRLVDHLTGPAWLTCLKLSAGGHSQIYAIFIRDNKIVDWRSGIMIDRCQTQSYAPLDAATGPTKSET